MNNVTVIFPPCAQHGEGDREAVEGHRAALTAFGPSAIRLRQGYGGRHLPKASLQGGNI